MDTSKWPEWVQQTRQRLLYIIAYLKTGSKVRAAKEAGYTSHNAHKRVLEHLEEWGRLEEAPHVRPPAKFTNAVMEEAMTQLLACDHDLTTEQLVGLLEQQGVLQAPTNCHNFLQHFKEYVGEQELTLKVADTSSTFRISEKTAEERYTFCSQKLQLLETDFKLENMVVCDETTFEESPHPKGGCCRSWWPPPLLLLLSTAAYSSTSLLHMLPCSYTALLHRQLLPLWD
jgi:hypothetical protein